MNDDLAREPSRTAPPDEAPTLGMSAIYKLFEAFIGLREKNERQHTRFESSLRQARDELKASFNSFAADTQRAYQQLRQELNGEKRVALSLFNELLEVGQDLEHITASRPRLHLEGEEVEAFSRWADAVEVECRKVQDMLRRLGVHRYDAVIGSAYDPKLHERVGSKRAEGMDALRVAEQREHGWASQQPEFVLRRPKVIVSE
jgi:molecular chaperone GrpE (heat shock protein)